MEEKQEKQSIGDWILRVVKGMFIGSGAILPGVSGGALAAVFGFYEQLITFISDMSRKFRENVLYFLPVGIGGLLGVFVLAYPLDFGLQHFPVHVLWGFIGAIIGTLPSLYKEAGKNGRETKHIILSVVTAILFFILLIWADNNFNMEVPQNFFTWLMAGAIFASGFVVPGLSPSNFLIYMNLYQPLTNGIRSLDITILIPVAIGAVLCVLLFAKAVRKLLDIAYPTVFHFVFGVVIASTAIIAPPLNLYSGMGFVSYLTVFIIFVLGLALGLWMGRLEDKYK